MKRFLVLFLLAIPAFGQTNIRWDWQANTVTGTGQMLPVLALPGAFVNFYTNCTALPCVTSAITYRSPTGSLTCPANSQVVWQLVTGCHATADSEGNFGGWFQAGAYQYVITVSGHQTGPYNFNVGGGSGGGGIAFFSAGNLPPLFTTTVANPSTAPNLTFNLTDAPANSIFGNFLGTTGPGFYAKFTCTGLLTCVYDNGTNTWNVDIPTASSLSITTTTPILVNGAHGPVDTGTANISCDPNGCGTPIQPLLTPPVVGQFVILHPTSNTLTSSGACTASSTPPEFPVSDNNSALLGLIPQASGFPPSNCQAVWSFAGALAAQYPSIPAANVTGVYATAVTGYYRGVGAPTIAFNGSSNFGPTGAEWALQQSTSGLTGITGPNLETATITGLLSRSATTSNRVSKYTINSPSFFVYYSGPPAPATNSIYLAPPLTKTIDANGNQVIGIDPNFPQSLRPQTLAQFIAAYGAAVGNPGVVFPISDGPNCGTGGGSTPILCYSDGTNYVAVGGTGSSTTYFTETLTCTSTCTLAHTPVTFDNISVNGLTMINGTDFTQSSTTVTLTTPAVGGDVYYAQYHY